ncbi:SDR family oxidoreductase [Shouchella patagoniensis]|uniref:SDR family oxidoreductase n=1 Tax=Shouchella patagoniensis TaxID=228576 RepID=UPI000994AD44|nr:SDR family oxidoreductase [Shouchella patagoniensis]
MSIQTLFDLTGKTAIVTGGGRGLGEAMAQALAEAGANVVVCSRKEAACQEVKQQIEASGGHAMALACDVTNEADVERIVEEVYNQYGKIDILINNSGTSWGGMPPEEMPADKFQKVVNVNLLGTFLMAKAVGKKMIADSVQGKIVNIASVAGLRGSDPNVMQAVGYNASKGGVITLTKDLAKSWGKHGITVNAIAPGFIPTKMTKDVIAPVEKEMVASVPLNRLGEPRDMQGAVLYLASEASSYVTGQTIVIDGGTTA